MKVNTWLSGGAMAQTSDARERVAHDAFDESRRETRHSPVLAERLGAVHGASVSVLGGARIAELIEALADSPRVVPWEASVVIATVSSIPELLALPGWLNECGVTSPVWVLSPHNRPGAPTATLVSRTMVEAGHIDSETTAVGHEWSARCFRRFSPRI